jgi:hypothetical protein
MKTIVSLAAAVFLLAASSLSAEARRPPVRPAEPVTVEIISEDGGVFQSIPYKSYRQGGTNIIKRYLEARKGDNYSIIIRNRTSGRVGVVVAVDGRNIISGKQSNLGLGEQMYLIEPYGYARLQGWRTDSSTVHRFYFTDVADSYSVRTFRDTSAMGVIAVAAFREKVKRPPVYKQGEAPDAVPSAPGSVAKRSARKADSAKSESAGTGFGESVYAPVERVEFEPVAVAAQKVLVKYEWRATLCKKGIISCGTGQGEGNRLWDDGGYAPHPPDYRGR